MSTENSIIIAAFTRRGSELALRIAKRLGNSRVFVPERLSRDEVSIIDSPLAEWTGRIFHSVRALVFIGACGIAVRAIAQHIDSKLTDPAVVVIDEAGHFVIPILSGHIGGANDLALKIANLLHAQAVITTATDVNNLPAVDEWAVKNDCVIENPEAIKHISGSLLEGERVGVAVTFENIPMPFPVTLWLRPRVLVLGAGCHRGVSSAKFEEGAISFLKSAGVSVHSLRSVASIDIKKDELAMISFAEKYNIPFITFSACELQALQEDFITRSERVKHFTGTDNVCERACILAAGEGSSLMRSKCVYGDMTFALARCRT